MQKWTPPSSVCGNIISLGTFWGEDASNAVITMKVSGVEKDVIIEKIKPHILDVIDVREGLGRLASSGVEYLHQTSAAIEKNQVAVVKAAGGVGDVRYGW